MRSWQALQSDCQLPRSQKSAVALVRPDVVDDDRRHDLALAPILGGERTRAQPFFAGPAPAAVMAAGRGGAALAVIALPALAGVIRAVVRLG